MQSCTAGMALASSPSATWKINASRGGRVEHAANYGAMPAALEPHRDELAGTVSETVEPRGGCILFATCADGGSSTIELRWRAPSQVREYSACTGITN